MPKPEETGAPTVTVTVFVGTSPDGKSFTWPKTKKVGDAAGEVAEVCGIAAEEPTFQNESDEILDRQKPLVAAGVHDGDKLEFVSPGGGV